MNCRVCSTKLPHSYTTCPYCGYGNAYLMSPFADDSSKYRNNLLESIQNITAMAVLFRYNERMGDFVNKGGVPLFEAPFGGPICYQNYIRSDHCIAHFNGDADLTISYETAGRKVEKTVPVLFRETKGLWYLALHINQKLQLEICWCIEPTPDSAGESERYCLAVVDLIPPLPGK